MRALVQGSGRSVVSPPMSLPRGNRKRILASALILGISALLAGVLSGCGPSGGWGLVLWTVEDAGIASGSVVPIHLKSNIGKVFVVGLPSGSGQASGSGSGSGRVEVPFWQIEEFGTRRAARIRAEEFKPFASIYMVAARDGLPIRDKPDNVSKRVFRLREGQTVKVLGKAEGTQVTTGGKALAGEWYRVLADDGTRGYVFSNTMRMYDETTGSKPAMESAAALSSGIDQLFRKSWRPAWYQAMVDEDRIDSDWFSLRFGLFSDAVNRQIRLEMPGLSRVFNYSSITEDSGWFSFTGTALRVRIESPSSVYAAWSGNPGTGEGDAETAGSAEDTTWRADDPGARFILLDSDIGELLRSADGRAREALRLFLSKAYSLRKGQGSAAAAPSSISLRSAQGSVLRISSDGAFSWSQTDFLPAGFPPPASGGEDARGTVRFGISLSQDLQNAWQGGFILTQEGGEGRSIYLYKMGQEGVTVVRAVQGPVGSPVTEADQRLGGFAMTVASQSAQ